MRTMPSRLYVDLIALQEQRSYKVPVNRIGKPPEFYHGTVVEVRGWWPEAIRTADLSGSW